MVQPGEIFEKTAFVFVTDHTNEPAYVMTGISPVGIEAAREAVRRLNKRGGIKFILDEKRQPMALNGPWYILFADGIGKGKVMYRLYYGAKVYNNF